MKTMDMFAQSIDLTNLSWVLTRTSSGTAGTYYKAYSEVNGLKRYYKLSSLSAHGEPDGNESFYEIIARNICRTLGYNHLEYELIYAKIRLFDRVTTAYFCCSEDFKSFGDKKITLENFYDLHCFAGEDKIEFLKRFNFWEQYEDMLILDFLIFNRDRHGANCEVLVNNGSYRLAPIFDNGISFFALVDRFPEQMQVYDYHKSSPANNYIGSYDTKENLNFVSLDKLKRVIDSEIMSTLFDDIPISFGELRGNVERFINIKLEDLEELYAARISS